jgi:hypothetical protein
MLLALVFIGFAAQAIAQSPDWPKVDSVLGRKGSAQPGDVMKYSFPRADLDVSAKGVKLKPAFALGSWVAFKHHGTVAMVMGDLVLTENEVDSVMSRLQSGGVQQTALHNHVLGESPRVMYMHIEAHGDAVKIASAIRRALESTGTPLASAAPAPPQSVDLDTAAVASALGYRGKINGGVYQVSVPRIEKVLENGVEIPASMGIATAINFQPTGGGKAAITGDFVMTGDEVNKVIRSLQSNGIQPTAIHSHMLGESPRLFFMHFWADDSATKLARGLRSALGQMHVARPFN